MTELIVNEETCFDQKTYLQAHLLHSFSAEYHSALL